MSLGEVCALSATSSAPLPNELHLAVEHVDITCLSSEDVWIDLKQMLNIRMHICMFFTNAEYAFYSGIHKTLVNIVSEWANKSIEH